MNRGLFIAANAMRSDLIRQDIRANNLANSSTPGFQRDLEVILSAAPMTTQEIGELTGPAPLLPSPIVVESITDSTQGPYVETGRSLDLVINGNAYLQIGTGNSRYFVRTLSAQTINGVLSDSQGIPIMGARGTIKADSSNEVVIGNDGSVTIDGQFADNLVIVGAGQGSSWVKNGNGGLVPVGTNPIIINNPSVSSGVLEQSNVDAISEMVGMMSGFRHYEANQKTVQAIDETLGKAVNEVGRVN